MGGLFVCCEQRVPIGTAVTVRFELPEIGVLEVPAYVRWNKREGLGLQFGLIGPKETRAIGMFVRSAADVPQSAE